MKSARILMFIVTITLLPASCTVRKEGAIEGTVSPASAGVRISAVQSGAVIATQQPDSATGRFHIGLPAGVYDVQVHVEGQIYPITLSNIVVESGRTTFLETVQLAPIASGTASISGRVISPAGAKVTLSYQGRERASLNADDEGRYEFTGLPPGIYTVQISAPGYAAVQNEIEIMDGKYAAGKTLLLYISDIPGIDWSKGRIMVTGTGLPPKKAANVTISREMARRAAIADGERRLLAAIGQIKTGPDADIKSLFRQKEAVIKIQGFVRGYRVVAERQLENGRIELDMELPLTGSGGLSSVLSDVVM